MLKANPRLDNILPHINIDFMPGILKSLHIFGWTKMIYDLLEFDYIYLSQTNE